MRIFPAEHNWGYDGVLPYAPDAAYGTPDELKTLIDTAHGLGLSVMLDVVYNHFGPDGNYLHAYAEQFFRDDLQTPWGVSIDFRKPQVRDYFIQNALYWLMEYRFDGLRFDAVHAISEPDFLDEMARTIRATVEPGRHVHLVLEHEGNKASHLAPGLFDAQWTDDWHHCMHVLLTGEREGYYEDFQDAARQLARAMAEGFVYQGDMSPHHGEPRGEKSGHLPPTAFVVCLQNHDQIGNRAFGDRLTTLARPAALRAATTVLLLSPSIPMLFMGEEWGTKAPFLFFTDHNEELAKLVREGRRREFKKFAAFTDPARRETIPDPNAATTFDASAPDASEATAGGHAAMMTLHRELLALRHHYVVPGIPGARSEGAEAIGPKAVVGRWRLGNGALLTIAVNLDEIPGSDRSAHGRDALRHRRPSDPRGAGGRAARRQRRGLHHRNRLDERCRADPPRRTGGRRAEMAGCVRERPRGRPRNAARRARIDRAAGRLGDGNRGEHARLDEQESGRTLPPLITGRVGEAVVLRTGPGRFRLTHEDGRVDGGELAADGRLPPIGEPGYHRLEVGGQHTTLAVAPLRCPSIADVTGEANAWGLAVQLYGLRRTGDGGIGDFAALADFVRSAAGHGASAVAISPVHAQFSADPDRFSPYAPSSRAMLNVLHAPLPDGAESERSARLEALDLVDWPEASRARLARFRAAFEQAAPDDPAFRAFREARGGALELHARSRRCTPICSRPIPATGTGEAGPRRSAPRTAPRSRASPPRMRARSRSTPGCNSTPTGRSRTRSDAAREAGMPIGLISDLAVGTDGGGSQGWGRQEEMLTGMSIGAPPDLLSPQGQSWGLVGFSPTGMRRSGFSAFIEMIRSALAHAGGLRIDHAMGLTRLWVLPDGATAADGAYLAFPRAGSAASRRFGSAPASGDRAR